MVKALMHSTDGGYVIVLGLSQRNCERLLGGEPILVEGKEFGLQDTKIVIMGGQTEAAIVQELRKLSGQTFVVPKVDENAH